MIERSPPAAQRRIARRTLGILAIVGVATMGCRRSPQGTFEGSTTTGEPSAIWFTEITSETGLDFRHDSGWDGSYFMPEHIGSGGALFDYDGDGDLDLYLVNSGPHGEGRATGVPATNRLFERQFDGTYEDRTERAGLGDSGYGMGAAVGDYDSDGDLDLYVTNLGPDALFRNDADGAFSRVTSGANISDDRWSTSACFFDYDRDGHLDLYVVTYVHHDPPKACTDEAGRPEYCGPLAFRGEPDLLYRNNGNGTFTDVSEVAGIGRVATRGLGIACLDLDDDGWRDVYVANDGEKNELWINRGDGTFEDQSLLLGVGLNMAGEAEASMGVAIGDVDGDLDLDLFLSHLDRESNTLYLNLGEGGFQDGTAAWRLGPESLPYTGFGTAFFDLELDGDLDLLVANGRVRRGKDWTEGLAERELEVAPHWRRYAEPNLLFVNEGTGRFRNASPGAGPLCGRIEVSRSVMLGDLDTDGDLDVVLTQCDGPTRIYRNDSGEQNRWSRVQAALGTRLELEAGGAARMGVITSTYSYLASVEPEIHFGLGGADKIDRLAVWWPDGARQSYSALPTGQRIRLARRRWTGS